MKNNLLFICLLFLISCSQSSKETTNNDSDHGHAHEDGSTHSHEAPDGQVDIDTLEKQVIPATSVSPEFVQLATNIEIIPNIEDAIETVGVLTHEGVFGPLLFAEETRAFFIELKPGMFLSEHPHPTESIVYTVSGRWVLCSEGKRQVIEAGSLFHFGSNMPTGWEAPFSEGAFLLVVKTKNEGDTFEPYLKGLKDMATKLDEERKAGTQFYFDELEPNHEAIQFARSVNPDFDEVLKNIAY
jgi:quercetin dioxygenase-like cupin family protein